MRNQNTPAWYDKLPAIYITKQEFQDLSEYSCSEPTGTTIGRAWKSNIIAYTHSSQLKVPDRTPIWMYSQYAEHPTEPDKKVLIKRFQLRIKGDKILAI